jgi:ArsR family transcriptional regulator, arsenate/arsenite/antimonite-responsive transcriptional repressor
MAKKPSAKLDAGDAHEVLVPGVPPRALKGLGEVFRGLADRSRLLILFLLERNGEMSVTAISTALGQSQPAVSHHLNQLMKAGLIDFRRSGKFNYYRLDPDGLAPLIAVLFPDSAAPAQLHFGGLDVVFRRKSERASLPQRGERE